MACADFEGSVGRKDATEKLRDRALEIRRSAGLERPGHTVVVTSGLSLQ